MNLGITHEVILVWIAAAVTLVVMIAGARLITINLAATGKFANLIEAMMDFVRTSIVEEFLGRHGKAWFGFFAALFFFLLTANLIGKLPGPVYRGVEEPHFWLESPTSNINVTAGMAIFVFLVAQITGIIKLGPAGYFKKKFLLPGAPWWVQPLAIIIMPIVLLAEPFSLAVRLFANMTAGHKVIVTFAVAELVGGVWLFQQGGLWAAVSVLPFVLSVVLLAFELFVAFIQAFIFTLLSALYLSESLEEHH
ncbi:MAG: F0F1 ATP synthase subunit A [Verrucomicrobia bacterium]|nr:F0F1 ATP synthase subunit A [Verrucomicrobiota bacterium]